MSSNPLHVAIASDEYFLRVASVMMLSVLEYHPGTTIHLMCPPETPQAPLQAVASMVKERGGFLNVLRVPDAWVDHLPPMRGIRRMVWYRVFLPTLLPEHGRVLYLDADTMVMGSLEEIWGIELGGRPVAAVANTIEPKNRIKQLANLDLPETATYFNSGVLLMDLEYMRREHSQDEILALTERIGDRFSWGDQDGLNGVFANDVLLLHPRWNAQGSLFFWSAARDFFGDDVVDEATSNPRVVHFGGGNGERGRPWYYLCDHPFRAPFLKYWYQIPLPGEQLIGATWRNRLRRFFWGLARVFQR